MFIRLLVILFFASLVALFCAPAAFCAPMDEWNALIVEGSKHKFDGQYSYAIQPFTKAVSLAEKEKLPDKCLPISLCRLAEVELITNNAQEADSHFEQIVDLIKTLQATNKLDPQVSFWAAALADEYQSNHKSPTQELYLRHACYLKALVYSSNHHECTDCLSKLAAYYIDNNQMDKAIHCLTMIETIIEGKERANSEQLGDTVHHLAIKYFGDHKYQQAKRLELAVIKMARTTHSSLRTGLPAFYSLLDAIALDRGEQNESKEYFHRAIQECSKIRAPKEKVLACQYLSSLADTIWVDKDRKSLPVETELRHMLAVTKSITSDHSWQYQLLSRLAVVLSEGKDVNNEQEKCMKQAIAIVELPNCHNKQDLPDLYMRLAMSQLSKNKSEEANKTFAKALDLEKDKNGFHAALIFYFWGCILKNDQPNLAAEKFNKAFQLIHVLPAEKRGTLLVDLFKMLAADRNKHGRYKDAQNLYKQASAEAQLQKRLNTHLGPDF